MTFVVSKDGKSVVVRDVHGFGDKCVEKTKPFENALGVGVEETREFTEEFHKINCENSQEMNS